MRLTWISCVLKLGMLAVVLNGQAQREAASSVSSTSAEISRWCVSFHLWLVEASLYAISREDHTLFSFRE